MDKEYAKKLLSKTTDDYNRIAELWSRKRWRLPSDIVELADQIKENENVLDLGCGNGYLYNEVITKKANYTGADSSENQLKVCKQLHSEANFVLTKPLELPLKEETFDRVFCLSTIHHIPTHEFQLKFLKEIWRVLKSGGQLYLTVWNLSEDEIVKSYEKIDQEGNIFYPFKDNSGVTMAERFIHIFSVDELSNLLREAGFQVVESRTVKRGYGKFSNNLVIAKKV